MRLSTWAAEVRDELGPTLRLAGPVVLAELGWMGMGIVDTFIVGPLGATAIGAVSIGSTAFFTPIIFGMGLLLGLDTMVAQAFGAGDHAGARRSLAQGVLLGFALTLPLVLVVLGLETALGWIGVNRDVLRLTGPYLAALAWGTLPLLIYAAFRRYLQAVNRPGPVLFALVSANLVNALGAWALVYGKLGMPALGVTGSGWATTIARVYMAGVLVAAAWRHDRRDNPGWRFSLDRWKPEPARLKRLLILGLPAAAHVTLEVGVFAFATALAGRLSPVALAAHHIVLNVSSVTFMIPLGLGAAGAVRVGQSIGRGNRPGAARAGWATLALTLVFMTTSGCTFALAKRQIVGAFTSDLQVLALGSQLMLLAAAFQLFDGIQGVTTGNLRGAGDTHTAFLSHAIAHGLIGLPLGYTMTFHLGYGVVGLWWGLTLGLVAASLFLGVAWVCKSRELVAG